MASRSTAAQQHAELGQLAFRKQDYDKAVLHFRRPCRSNEDEGTSTERILHLLALAHALLHLEGWSRAAPDIKKAILIGLDKVNSRNEGAEKELQAQVQSLRWDLLDALANNEYGVGKQQDSVNIMLEDLGMLQQQVERDIAASSLAATTSMPSTRLLFSRAPQLDVMKVVGSTASMDEKRRTVIAAQAALAVFWEMRRATLISSWNKPQTPAERRDVCSGATTSVVDAGGTDLAKLFPELQPHVLAEGWYLIDLIAARATLRPAEASFRIDLPVLRARHKEHVGRLRSFLSSLVSGRKESYPSTYVSLQDGFTYGEVVSLDPTSLADKELYAQRVRNNEACTVAEAEVLLERQRVLYLVALRAARLLFTAHPTANDLTSTRNYRMDVIARRYAGRDGYKRDRVEVLAKELEQAASEDLETLKTDPLNAVSRLLDRLGHTASKVGVEKAKTGLCDVLTSAVARQVTGRAVVDLLSDLAAFPLSYGSSPRPLPPEYTAKATRLLELVTEHLRYAYADFAAAVKRNCRWVPAADSVADLNKSIAALASFGTRAQTEEQKKALFLPVARILLQLAKRDPLKSDSMWEDRNLLWQVELLLNCGAEVRLGLPRSFVQAWSVYSKTCELRELLLDAHRPTIDVAAAEPSCDFEGLRKLTDKLERCWKDCVSGGQLHNLILTRSKESLNAIHEAFSLGVSTTFGEPLEHVLAKALRPESRVVPCEDSPPIASAAEDSTFEVVLDDPTSAIPGAFSSTVSVEHDSEPEATLVIITTGRTSTPPESSPRRRRRLTSSPPPRPPVLDPPPGPSFGTPLSTRQVVLSFFGIQPCVLAAVEVPDWLVTSLAAPTATPCRPEPPPPSPKRIKDVEENHGSRSDPLIATKAVKKVQGRRMAEKRGPGADTRVVLPPGLQIKVSRKTYEVLEVLLGSKNGKTTHLAYTSLLKALCEVGFDYDRSGSSVGGKLIPSRGALAQVTTAPLDIHPPHTGGPLFHQHQLLNLPKRFKRHYGLSIDHFAVLDGRGEAQTVAAQERGAGKWSDWWRWGK
ncbi:hypothetical protein JCM10207_005368 [Rhodosporidiobolus poonsookiae]